MDLETFVDNTLSQKDDSKKEIPEEEPKEDKRKRKHISRFRNWFKSKSF